MIKIENVETCGWKPAIRGMRNSYESWDKSDSKYLDDIFLMGKNDKELMMYLCRAGSDHRKFMRMIICYADITAPLYWWKQADTYRIGVERNSCSTMHRISTKAFTLEDFSYEHLDLQGRKGLEDAIAYLNDARDRFKMLDGTKSDWWQMIQLLPSSYNQKRTCMISYEALRKMYHSRKNHKLDEWKKFCGWMEGLPYSELITGDNK